MVKCGIIVDNGACGTFSPRGSTVRCWTLSGGFGKDFVRYTCVAGERKLLEYLRRRKFVNEHRV